MKLSSLKRLPLRWRANVMRTGFNLNPAFRGTGGRVEFISRDLLHVRIRLALTRRTRNFVGSLYGGSLFAVTDGVHVAMLLTTLHRDVIIWDKAAAIRYRKPAYCTVYADIHLLPADLDEITRELDADHETSRRYTIELKDKAGTVYTVVERMVYIADKAYYKQKMRDQTPGDKK
ncbi:MAG TPA: DUF4442 domain-containing protein [Candidimonas sp.]|nr:DUF4442 domain-containing protein [Candidimonas sp.]